MSVSNELRAIRNRCKHRLRVYDSAIVYAPHVTSLPVGTFGPGWASVPGSHRCSRCHETLPLGPSSDGDERVGVEIRAAELSTRTPDQMRWREDMSGSECREGVGWEAHACGFFATWCNDDPDALAGYLARCIATHEEQEGG